MFSTHCSAWVFRMPYCARWCLAALEPAGFTFNKMHFPSGVARGGACQPGAGSLRDCFRITGVKSPNPAGCFSIPCAAHQICLMNVAACWRSGAFILFPGLSQIPQWTRICCLSIWGICLSLESNISEVQQPPHNTDWHLPRSHGAFQLALGPALKVPALIANSITCITCGPFSRSATVSAAQAVFCCRLLNKLREADHSKRRGTKMSKNCIRCSRYCRGFHASPRVHSYPNVSLMIPSTLKKACAVPGYKSVCLATHHRSDK